MLSDKLKAIEFAIVAHEGQLRKGSEIPYATHVISVGQILQEFGYEDSAIIAGILHDTIEDTSTAIDEIEVEFGQTVAKIVQGCTEDKRLSWEKRKSYLIETLGMLDEETQAVVIADKLHNLMSIEREMDQSIETI
jgi:(p)ppGpp synthase/HD superfamily hydrolase